MRQVTTLSVIVPATNAPATLDACLAAISTSKSRPEQVIVVRSPELTSPAGARNEGAGEATGDVLVFIDADVAVHDDALGRIREAFDGDDSLSALFGSYDDSPPEPDAVSGFRNLLHHHVHQQGGGDAKTFWAGLGAIRRSVFVEMGGFVEHPVEDIELGMRLHAAGARIRLDPSIQGAHMKRWGLVSMIRTDVFVRGIPWVGLLLRHRSAAVGLNLGWRHRLSALAAVALVVAIALLSPLAAAVAVAVLIILNASFYRLLLRRRGLLQAAIGFVLHVVHHLLALASLAIGVAVYAVRRGTGDEAPALEAESQGL
jgi:hypothetical protein